MFRLRVQLRQNWPSLPRGVVRDRKPRLLRKTQDGLTFASEVAGVAPVSPAAGPEAFVTGGALNPPLCERIHDTLRQSIRQIVTRTKESP
jgi:hypothetical protein